MKTLSDLVVQYYNFTFLITAFPASSATAERGFSVSGALLAKRRSNMSATTAEFSMLVHQNYNTLKTYEIDVLPGEELR